jgi:D-3-phosphoglycerate dehydrogenase
VLEKLPECRALFRSGSGLDALPVARATELGIAVCNTPESIAESVAEHAVALLFSLVRQIPQFDREVRGGEWNSGNSRTRWHLSGRTLGLVGYGRIARNVEQMVSGFKMRVLHFDPFSPTSTPLDDLLKESDFISLHCPLSEATHHLIGAEELKLMKAGVLLVNTSRGPVVDETALIAALKSGRIGGAALDVTAEEPPSPDNPLQEMDNVILTPHVAAFSADFEKNFWDCSVKKLIALKSGNFKGESANLK